MGAYFFARRIGLLRMILWMATAKRLHGRAKAGRDGECPLEGDHPVGRTAGILDTSGNLLYTSSSLTGRLDMAAVLSSLYPAGTILLAVWLLRERTTRSQSAGMVWQ